MFELNKKKPFNIRSVLVTAVSFILLWLTIRKSGLQWSHLQLLGSQWIYFFTSMIVLLITIWIQSIRAKIPWEPWLDVRKTDTFNGLLLGNFYNCILPGNLGEGVRVWHFSRKNKVSFVRALASLGVEKYIDAIVFITYPMLLLFFFSNADIHLRFFVVISCLIAAVFTFYLIIITQRKVEIAVMGVLLRFFGIGKWLYKLHFHIKGFLTTLSKMQLFRLVWIGVAMFMLNITQYYLVMMATGVPEPLISVKVAFLVATGMVIVSVTPAAPGNVGVIHFGIYTLLSAVAASWGMAPTESLLQTLALYTIYLHLSYFVPEVVVGAIVLIKEKRWLF